MGESIGICTRGCLCTCPSIASMAGEKKALCSGDNLSVSIIISQLSTIYNQACLQGNRM